MKKQEERREYIDQIYEYNVPAVRCVALDRFHKVGDIVYDEEDATITMQAEKLRSYKDLLHYLVICSGRMNGIVRIQVLP